MPTLQVKHLFQIAVEAPKPNKLITVYSLIYISHCSKTNAFAHKSWVHKQQQKLAVSMLPSGEGSTLHI